MQQIADWRKELGMAEYAERFAEKRIDIGVLRDLADQDLKDLGVVSIGHRRPPRLPCRSRRTTLNAASSQDIAALQLAARDYLLGAASSVRGVGAGADGRPLWKRSGETAEGGLSMR